VYDEAVAAQAVGGLSQTGVLSSLGLIEGQVGRAEEVARPDAAAALTLIRMKSSTIQMVVKALFAR